MNMSERADFSGYCTAGYHHAPLVGGVALQQPYAEGWDGTHVTVFHQVVCAWI
jgi:hypothetical protein